jgi:hypothetical protein
MSVDLILLIAAAICFALAALNIDLTNGKVNLTALGLFLWVLTLLI